ncbi:MAG: ComEC/Rec2 family competence protein, partial [Clostridia bacterium]|nr:ComEC/Rec2 family competence protein [Clostridia bacterium]
ISSVCAAAFVILIISPAQLFCVGFQLSFSIVATVIILYNPLKKTLKFLPEKLTAAFTVSALAEVGGIPVLLYAFGKFASLSLFINLLFIPLAGIVFIALILCTALSVIIPPAVCLFLPNYAIFGLNSVIGFFDFKVFLIGGFTLGAFAAAYYGTIVVAGGLVNFRKAVNTSVACVLAVICAIGTVAVNVGNAKKISATVIGSESVSAVFITAHGENLLVISEFSYRTFSQYRLNGATKSAGGRGVSVVVLKQNNPVELPATVNRLTHIMKVERLYYCGEKDEDGENAVFTAFNGLKAIGMADGDGFSFGGGRCETSLDGKCLLCTVNGYTTPVFARFDGLGYGGLTVRINTAICFDCHGAIERNYAPENTVSFRAEYGYPDGETHGNIGLVLG